MSTVPVPVGLVAVIDVSEWTTTWVAATEPKRTRAPATNPCPVIVTVVPPARGPWPGDTPVTAVAVTGCQWGISFPRSPVSTVAAPPPAGMTSIVWPAAVARANRSFVPSGDHAGWNSAAEPVVTRWSVPEPTATVQMSNEPYRLVANAIFDPSGDQAG